MENISKISKLFLFISLCAAILWFGSYMARMVSVFQLFEGPDLAFKPYLTGKLDSLVQIYSTLNPLFVITNFSFFVSLISFVLFLLISRVSLKNEGWLFIITAIVIAMASYEIFLIFKFDYPAIHAILNQNFNSDEITILLQGRIKAAGGFTIILPIAFLSIVYLFFYKPFRKIPDNIS